MADWVVRMRVDTSQWRQLARDVRRLAAELPEERRIILQGMNETIHAAVEDQYSNWVAPGGRALVPKASGRFGAGIRVWVQPQMGAVSVRSNTPHAGFAEFGRPPGPVPQAVIAAWVEEKGIADAPDDVKFIARAIARRISRQGYKPLAIISRATSPYSDGVGPSLHRELGAILTARLRTLFQKYGWS